jgi:carotenoid cleavage dioxygenase-like enzyme
MMLPLGSAHPHYVQGGACILNVDSQSDMLGLAHKVLLYKMCADAPDQRVLVNSYAAEKQVYLHSWGMSQTMAVIPHQHFTMSMMEIVMFAETLSDAFKSDALNSTDVYLVPLDGSEPVRFTLPNTRMFYTHFVNAFDTAESTVFDVCMDDANPFLASPFTSIPLALNATARNDKSALSMGVVTRVELFTSGPRKGESRVTPITRAAVSTDFPNMNRDYQSRAHCHFYAVEWFHDTVLLGSMAIAKHTVCGATGHATGHATPRFEVQPAMYWYEPGMFPSEPTFLPTPGSAREDDGVLIFAALHGLSQTSFLVAVDATTMAELERVPLPQRLTFSTHGEFFAK